MDSKLRGHSVTCLIISIIELVSTILNYVFWFIFLNTAWFMEGLISLSTSAEGIFNIKRAMLGINIESFICIPVLIAAIVLMSLNLSAKTEESISHSKIYLLITRIILVVSPVLGMTGAVMAILILNYHA